MITLMQTADAVFYYPMLVETAKTVRAFCARNGFAYEQYVGIKRGHMPWQASYNRIYMLKEMVDRGVEGWVFYLDADAFIQDLDFDLAAYLEARSQAAGIFSGYSTCELPYDINSGGFALNLSHPVAKAIVFDWYQSIATVPAREFDGAVHWQHDLGNDQHLLCHILRRYIEDAGVGDTLIFERANRSYVNNGPFVSQLLRSMFPTHGERLATIKKRVAETLVHEKQRSEREGPGVYMRAHHPRLVSACGRKTLSGISSTGNAGGLMFGPYIRLDAGRYVARIYGQVNVPDGSDGASFATDIAIDKGFAVLSAQDRRLERSTKGLIVQNPFELAEDTDSLEVRVTVGAEIDMSIHAIQIVPSLL